jgi:hypothetical protein
VTVAAVLVLAVSVGGPSVATVVCAVLVIRRSRQA